ncbi:MAG: FtsX-like permease family protein, partial [Myxococcota bacterium]
MGAFFTIAARNLWLAKRRTFMVGGALAAVTLFLVLLMALSLGLYDTIVRSSTVLLSGHVNIGGFFKAKPSDRNPMITHASELRALVEQEVDGVDYVIDRQRGFATVISDRDSLQSILAGVDINQEQGLVDQISLAPRERYRPETNDPRIAGQVADLAEANTVMLFAGQAERLEVDVGDFVTLSAQLADGTVNTVDVRVVAVAEDVGFLSSFNAFVNQDTVRALYRLNRETTGAIMIYLDDPDRAGEVMNTLRDAVEGAGFEVMEHSPQPFFAKFEVVAGEDWTGLKLDLTIWRDEIAPLKWTLNAIDTVSGVLIVILTVIIVVGIMNTMWISVRERTNEVGTLRAIGMGRLQVLMMFVFEAAIL